MPEQIVVVTKRSIWTVAGYLLTARQEANDQANEWGIARILVFNTLNPSSPPLPEQIAAMVVADEFKGVYRATGGMIGGGMIG